jgi:hypothetical protein
MRLRLGTGIAGISVSEAVLTDPGEGAGQEENGVINAGHALPRQRPARIRLHHRAAYDERAPPADS